MNATFWTSGAGAKLIAWSLVASAGNDEINIKKAEPTTNCFIAPPVLLSALSQKDFEIQIKEEIGLKEYW
jgi:hypothetical protein